MATPTFSIAVEITPSVAGEPRTVTSDVIDWTTTGANRSSPVEMLGLATATITLDNTLGAYDPAVHRTVEPGATVTLTVAGTGDIVFQGVITRARLVVGRGRDSWCVVDAAQRAIRDTAAVDGSYGATTVGGLITFTGGGSVELDTVWDDHDPAVAATTIDTGTSFWAIVTDLAESLGGVVYYNPDAPGWTYVSRARRSTDAYATYAAEPIDFGDGAVSSEPLDLDAPIEVELSDDHLFNVVTAEASYGASGTTVTVTESNVATFGTRALTRQGPFNTATLSEIATEMVVRYGSLGSLPGYAHPREVSVQHAEYLPLAALTPLLRADYPRYALVSLTFRPGFPTAQATRTAFYLVDGRTLSGDADGSISMTLTLAPAARDGDAVYDDQAAFGGYDFARYA